MEQPYLLAREGPQNYFIATVHLIDTSSIDCPLAL